jgi:hypothetical protein
MIIPAPMAPMLNSRQRTGGSGTKSTLFDMGFSPTLSIAGAAMQYPPERRVKAQRFERRLDRDEFADRKTGRPCKSQPVAALPFASSRPRGKLAGLGANTPALFAAPVSERSLRGA